ncbi:hypothetical protein [Tepidibacter hydrothermalis]|uniref:Uncharacterized protein n=1 Tax=Tepidibacter hydrothermalis TaxID=3036126 RepID=A0ABY8EGD7_9FIRM|nr:hypothetical protein [Tepidibacter hydrothermalis]WFD10915.1 hypothetical protein P4S50_02245 [Tepidibacter hydrothermalis]
MVNLDNIEKNEQTNQYIEKYNLKVKEIIKLFNFENMIIYSDENERFKFLQEGMYITQDNKIMKRYKKEYIEELIAFLIFREDDSIELDLTSIA